MNDSCDSRLWIALGTLLVLGGCSTPSVNLATTEPIKVDINMRLDVYQHSTVNTTPVAPKPTPGASAATASPTPVSDAPTLASQNRSALIQKFKMSGNLGEAVDGLLVVRVDPGGLDGSQLREAVREENAVRMNEMQRLSDEQKLPLPTIQKQQGTLNTDRAFKGEWIQTTRADGDLAWTQKP